MTQPPPPLSAFERVLSDFKNDLTQEELKEFDGVTLDKLEKKLVALQQQQKARKTMQNLTRIQGFIEAMKTYSQVLDVFVNVHDFVAFIWGPIKFLLLTASNFIEAFNGLLDAYKKIAERLPLLEQYQSLFGTDEKVKKVLELTFRDIFQFHREALVYFRKPGWKLIFHSTWNKFKTTFGTILDSIESHKQLLIEQASLEHIHQTQEEFERSSVAREEAAAHRKVQDEQERLARLQRLASWLSGADVHADQETISKVREGHPQSCRWIVKKTLYQAWYDTSTTSEPTLWIHGIPGAGKSVLASFIIEETMKLADYKTLFFYCRHDDPQRNSFVAMARAILWELAQHSDTVAEVLFDASTKGSERLQLRSQKLAAQLLDSAFQATGRLAIVIDGLDECIEQEQKHIVTWLKKFIESSSTTAKPSICVFLSQYDATTKSLMSKLPTLRISASDNAADIEAYCVTKARQVQHVFSLDATEADSIATKTAKRAEGMFLFARLAMEHFLEQTNLYDLEEEMRHLLESWDDQETGTQAARVFQNLDIAYSRIVRRVVGDESALTPRGRDALQLLKWLVCAIRPLTWEEMQTAICLDLNAELVHTMRRRAFSAKDLCGSLVDVGSRGEINLVHSTAKVYLEKAQHVYPPDEHLRLTHLCLAHFCFSMFETEMENQKLDDFILQGSYGFLEYSIVSWTTHLELALKPRASGTQPPTELLDEVEETLESFFSFHYHEAAEKNHVPRHFIEPVSRLRNSDLHAPTLATMASVHKITTAEVPKLDKVSTLGLFPFTFRVRDRMERMLEEDPTTTWPLLEQFYGAKPYKCPRVYCDWFHLGFHTAFDRQQHIEKHERAFRCPHNGCVSATLGWVTKKELDQHIAAHHASHDDFPPETEEVESNTSKARDTKHPAKFQCNECPRSFTRQYNLRSHLLTHSNERPHACNECNRRFHRLNDLKRHQVLHTGKKEFVCRGTLTTGERWGCGRRFARADMLQDHFNSIKERRCTKPIISRFEDQLGAEQQKVWLEKQQRA